MAILTQYQCDVTGEIFQKKQEVVEVELQCYVQEAGGYRCPAIVVRKLVSLKKAQQMGLTPLKTKDPEPEVVLTFGQKLEMLMRQEMQEIADDAATDALSNNRN